MGNLLGSLKPYRLSILFVLVLLFLQALTELALPTLMAGIVDSGVARADQGIILHTGALMLSVALAGMVCSAAATYFSSKVSAGFGRDLRRRVFGRAEDFSLHEFDRFGTATLITRTTNDVTQVQTFVLMALRMLVSAPLLCIGGVVMALRLDTGLSWVLLAALPVLVGTIAAIAGASMGFFRQVQIKLDHLNLVLRERLGGVRVVRAFDREGWDEGRLQKANSDLTAVALKAQHVMAGMMPSMMLIMNLTTLAILWFGSVHLDAGSPLGVGGLMAFLQYAIQILFSLMMMSMVVVMYPRASVSAGRIAEVLQAGSGLNEPAEPRTPASPRGVVEFRNVVFRYPGAEAAALEGVSFRASPGEVTAIIGGTGSGKSTLVSLIPRFYDAESGSVEIDGVDVRSWPQEALRQRIGFVSQKAVLFSDSVENNLRLGRRGATDEELQTALAVAQADFVAALPEGVRSPVARGGSNLSGGQKQRLAIARAVVRRPDIYVFDDSFSALDFKTDAALRAALEPVTADATVLLVAQRVSTVVDADRIIVLEDGRVAGLGTHGSLLKDCAVYQEIVASQMEVRA